MHTVYKLECFQLVFSVNYNPLNYKWEGWGTAKLIKIYLFSGLQYITKCSFSDG